MKPINILSQFGIILLFLTNFNAQNFTELEIDSNGFSYGELQWVDYDGDDDLDFAVTGFVTNGGRQAVIYENIGNSEFIKRYVGFTGTTFGSLNWGDYDNDGDIDFFINGRTDSAISYLAQVYENNGDGTFTAAESLASLDYGTSDWGDYNNDGFLDIILTGSYYPGWEAKTFLYQNDKNGSFFIDDSTLLDFNIGTSKFADYDNDGDLDLFLTGLAAPFGVYSTIYRNDNNAFTNVDPGITGLTTSESAWGDYDSDGDLDFVIGGSEGSISLTKANLYRNEGNDSFSKVEVSGDQLPQVSNPSFDWGDFDNDGDLDLLITGQIGLIAERFTGIYRNEGNDTFTIVQNNFTSVRNGDARWGDYDNDGDLDFILCGTDPGSGKILKLYRNELNNKNNKPTAPSELFHAVKEDKAALSWSSGSDLETGNNSLSYNIRIGTEPGYSDILSAMSDNNGFRKLVKHGNVGLNENWEIEGLKNGTYYWSVQTIDGGFSASEFSAEATFEIGNITSVDETQKPNSFLLEQNYPNPFNPTTTINFVIPAPPQPSPYQGEGLLVTLSVFDILGTKISTLVNETKQPGSYEIKFDANDLPSGLYFYKLTAGKFSETKKMLLLK